MSNVFAQVEESASANQRLEELRFGEVLYAYFQNAPMASLQAIELAKLKGFPDEEQARLQLMEGGASLQLGMTQTASDLLRDLLAQTQPEDIQAQAWYWLAKTAFQQGLYGVSEEASEYIIGEELGEFISNDQRLELAYQNAYYQLQHRPEDWQSTIQEVDKTSKWFPYLLANAGIQAFNRNDYGLATSLFVDAIKAVREPSETDWDWSFDWFDVPSINWWPWSGDTPADTSIDTEALERNILLDRLYLMLGRTFIEQNNFNAAFNTLKQIQSDSLYSEEGMLAYGWALANDARWSEAMAIWQYLSQSGKGLQSLQATHALAYGFEQLTDYQQAYAMLESSLSQLQAARNSLAILAERSQNKAFFEQLASTEEQDSAAQWPRIHQDLLVDMLSGDNTVNTAKQLHSLVQLLDLSRLIERQQRTIGHLDQLLIERKQSLEGRANRLQLDEKSMLIEQLAQQLMEYKQSVEDAKQSPINFANTEQKRQFERIQGGLKRLQAQRSDPALDKTKADMLEKRLVRLLGVLEWQLAEQQVAQQYSHEQAITGAQSTLDSVASRLTRLQQLVADDDRLQQSVQQDALRLDTLRQRYTTQNNVANMLQQQLVAKLQAYLQTMIADRDAILLEQITATRLAMLRMQDISFSRQLPARGTP